MLKNTLIRFGLSAISSGRPKLPRRFSALLLVGAATAALAATDYSAEGRRWWSHIEYLADDKLEGRNVGTLGYEKAAEYVSEQFRAAGLKPAGTEGYFQ